MTHSECHKHNALLAFLIDACGNAHPALHDPPYLHLFFLSVVFTGEYRLENKHVISLFAYDAYCVCYKSLAINKYF